jgi:hypothetical protein
MGSIFRELWEQILFKLPINGAVKQYECQLEQQDLTDLFAAARLLVISRFINSYLKF